MMKALFVSPHSDDVCLSMAGFASRVAAPKHLLTVFSASAWTEHTWQGSRAEEDVSARRTAEDLAFCSMFHFDYHCLGLPDSSIRHEGRGNLRHPSGDETDLQLEVQQAILALADRHEYDALVAPLGIGGHADHVVCHRAVRHVAKKVGVPTVFYEDLPYANELPLWRISVAARMVNPRLTPVPCRTSMRPARKLKTCHLYETQRNEIIFAALVEHSARLCARFGHALGIDDPFDEVVERLWTRDVSILDRLCDARAATTADANGDGGRRKLKPGIAAIARMDQDDTSVAELR